MTILDRPPPNWKRPAMPMRVRLQVILNQDGRCKETGIRLHAAEDCRFDHRPALWERQFDDAANDTIPSANDPAFIEAVSAKGHDVRTHGPGGEQRITTAGSDSGRRAKEQRLAKKHEEFRLRVLRVEAEDDGDQPSRGKRSRKWPSRKIASRGFAKPRLTPKHDEEGEPECLSSN